MFCLIPDKQVCQHCGEPVGCKHTVNKMELSITVDMDEIDSAIKVLESHIEFLNNKRGRKIVTKSKEESFVNNRCFVKKVDDMGNMVIPVNIRRALGIDYSTLVDVTVEGDTVVIKKHKERCSACHRTGDLIKFRDVNLCPECQEGLMRL